MPEIVINQGPQFEGLRKRPIPHPTQVVLHHTGGVGDHTKVFATLRRRGLSIHYVVDRDGSVWQLAPDSALCAHASGVNHTGVGIEVVSRGYSAKAGRLRYPGVHHHTAHVHGRIREDWISWTQQQREAVPQLVKRLCEEHGIPVRVPRDANGELVTTLFPAARAVAPKTRSVKPDHWRGIIGHFHVSATKVDPSPLELLLVARAIGAT